jgi:LysM repeat protein
MDFNQESFSRPLSASSHGAESLAREVQNQMMGTQAVSLDKLALPAPGADAALGLGAPVGSEQALSPLMSIISKMPGHIGFFSSFFEGLMSFLFPQDLMNMLDPNNLGLDSLFSPDHMSLDLSLLPDDAPILSNLDSGLGLGRADMLSGKLNMAFDHGSLSREAVSSFKSLNVSGNVLGKSQFEGGVLSGPNMQSGLNEMSGGHLSSNTRLFADNSGEAASGFSGSFKNMTSTGNSLNSNMNVSGSNLNAGLSANGQSLSISGNGNLNDLTVFDPSFKGALKDNLLAANPGDPFKSSFSFKPEQAAGTDLGKDLGGKDLGGMKAKALSFDGKNNLDLNKAELGDKNVGSLNKDQIHDSANHSQVKDSHAKADHAKSEKISHKSPFKHKHTATAQPKTAAAAQSNTSSQNQIAEKPAEQAQAPQAQDNQPLGDQTQQNQAQAEASSSTYTIKAGDNLWNIAKDQLGNATKWNEIYKLNQDLLGANPDLIRPGTTIQLPGAEVAAGGDIAHYTVKPGDNLWDIAKEQLGDGSKWGEIYKNNEGIIGDNPSLIQPGQELSLGASNNASLQMAAQPQAQPQTLAQTPDPQALGQTAMQTQPVQNYGFEQGMGGSSSMQNFEAAPMQMQPQMQPQMPVQQPINHSAIPASGVPVAKVIPQTAAPDAFIPPAHAADKSLSFSNFENIDWNTYTGGTKSSVSSSMGSDLYNFLKNNRK